MNWGINNLLQEIVSRFSVIKCQLIIASINNIEILILSSFESLQLWVIMMDADFSNQLQKQKLPGVYVIPSAKSALCKFCFVFNYFCHSSGITKINGSFLLIKLSGILSNC